MCKQYRQRRIAGDSAGASHRGPVSRLTRRQLLSGAGVAGGAMLFGGHGAFGAAAQATPIADDIAGITTLDQSLTPGDFRTPGLPYQRMMPAGGWPLVVREDIAPANPNRERARASLAAFAHLTDLHIIDAASPAHPTFLRQFSDGFAGIDFSNGFRTQDTLTVHVLDAMVRRFNALRQGPITARPFDFAISTGDNADDRGTHELATVLAVLNGGQATFNATGGEYAGLQGDAELPEPVYDAFWHPNPPKGPFQDDSWKRTFGYPTLPGLLDAAARPIDAPGLAMPWYGGFGNHDIIDAGVLPGFSGPAVMLDLLATGDRMPYALPDGMSVMTFLIELLNLTTETDVRALIARLPSIPIPASEARKPFSRREFIQMHLDADGPFGPAGHGYTPENLEQDTGYYRFPIAPGIVGITLDSTNPNGGQHGSLDPGQADWLEQQLTGVHSRYLDAAGAWVETDHDNQLAILFSHHNSETFDNLTKAPGETTSDRLASADLLKLLWRFPNVVLWVNGHSHRNWVRPHKDPDGRTGGFWEINTAAHIDYPQQARSIEIADNRDGTLSIFGILIDHSDHLIVDAKADYSRAELAALSLELAANDPSLDRASRLGAPEDRNVELVIGRPF